MYVGWFKIFGFGLPYSMCTRTPWEEILYFVGVPPYDVLDRILLKVDGKNRVERKRSELDLLLSDHSLLELEVQRRIDIGMYDLSLIAASFRESSTTQPPRRDRSRASVKDSVEEIERARGHCLRKLTVEMRSWRDRLPVRSLAWEPLIS